MPRKLVTRLLKFILLISAFSLLLSLVLRDDVVMSPVSENEITELLKEHDQCHTPTENSSSTQSVNEEGKIDSSPLKYDSVKRDEAEREEESVANEEMVEKETEQLSGIISVPDNKDLFLSPSKDTVPAPNKNVPMPASKSVVLPSRQETQQPVRQDNSMLINKGANRDAIMSPPASKDTSQTNYAVPPVSKDVISPQIKHIVPPVSKYISQTKYVVSPSNKEELSSMSKDDIKPQSKDVFSFLTKDGTKNTAVDSVENNNGLKQVSAPYAKYLLPITFLQGGPSFYYHNYKVALFYAISHRWTVVTPPFANHYGHKEEQFWWPFNETFDVGILRETLPVISIDKFKTLCNGSADVVLMEPYTQRNNKSASVYEYSFNKTRDWLEMLTGITIPSWDARPRSVSESQRRYIAVDGARCVCMFKPLDFWKRLKYEFPVARKRSLMARVSKHLVRAPYIRERTDAIMTHICNGRPFLSMHWRNRSGEVCGRELRNFEKLYKDCDSVINYVTMASRKVAKGIKDIMDRRGLYCAYVSHPSYSEEIVHIMREIIPHVYTSKDILSLNIPAVARLGEENYLLSLVEQEIVSRGVVFIASLTSNWSQFVAEERSVVKKRTIFLNEVPGVPKQLFKLV